MFRDVVRGVRTHGSKVALAGALVASQAMAAVKPVSADGIGQANCDTKVTLTNPEGIVNGVYTAKKARFIVETRHISDSESKLPNDNIGPEIAEVLLVNYGQRLTHDINPVDVTTHTAKIMGELQNGNTAATGEESSCNRLNLTVAFVRLADGRVCQDLSTTGSVSWQSIQGRKDIEKVYLPEVENGNK